MKLLGSKNKKKPDDETKKAEVQTNPYLAGRLEWNERYGSYIAQARNWRLAAIAATLVSLVLAFGLVYVSGQSKLVPYVVEVDKLGDAVAVQRADRASTVDDRVVKAQLAEWIVDARAVSIDPVAEHRTLDRVYALADQSTTSFLNDYYSHGHSPFGAGKTVQVTISSILATSDRTWEIQWTEKARDLTGQELSNENWQAVLTVGFTPPTQEEAILKNPLGLFITSLNWTKRV